MGCQTFDTEVTEFSQCRFRRSSATSSICVNWRLYPAFKISGVFARDVVPVDLVEQRKLISSAKDYVLPFLMTRCVGAWNCCFDSEQLRPKVFEVAAFQD
jgi:hypothetical protein